MKTTHSKEVTEKTGDGGAYASPTPVFSGSFLIKALALFFIIALVLSACGAPAAEEPAAPEEPAATEAPLEPGEPSEGLPVQYGQDTRTEFFEHGDARLKEMAASVAVFVHKSQIEVSGDQVRLEGYTLSEMSEMGWLVRNANLPMCTDELFASQPAPGFCTGFLVREDILVTAGHCLQKAACADTKVVFGFQMASKEQLAGFTKDNVFECKEVLEQVLPSAENGYLDYAILKLNRPTGRAGLSYSSEDLLQAQNDVAVLGYPSGLPLKIASNAFVMSNDVSSPFFITNLDTFGSNSGSPVINMDTYQVEGILVRGTTDYVLSADGSCVQVNRCPEGGDATCAGENATKMSHLAAELTEILSRPEQGWSCFPGLLLVFVLIAFSRMDSLRFK